MYFKFGPIVLADPLGGIDCDEVRFDGQRVVQTVEYPEGEEPKNFDRGNRSKRLTFKATRQFDTEDDAQRFCIEHDEELPIVDELQVEAFFGSWAKFYPGAALNSVRCYDEGVRVHCEYDFLIGLGQSEGTKTNAT